MKLLLALILSLTGALAAFGPSVPAAPATHAAQSGKYEAAGIEDGEAAERFLSRLQGAVARGERRRVASMIQYPLNVHAGGRRVRVRDRAELLRRYDSVFNRKVRRALARQKAADLFVNWQGVMVGDGEVWFRQPQGGRDFKVVAINN